MLVVGAGWAAGPASADVTLNPVADTYVRSDTPTTNYGTAREIRVRGGGSLLINGLLRFTVSGVGSVSGAKLRVFVTDATAGETETVRRIVGRLNALPPERARLVASAAYILARAANADMDISDEETKLIEQQLQERGMLDETLIVWGGEFGRSPFREGRTAASANLGRDHHPFSFTLFLAGGGLRHGMTYGASDELGFDVGENPVHVHDLQATILHLLGMDHLKLTYRYSGRDFRLTDVFGHLVKDILA